VKLVESAGVEHASLHDNTQLIDSVVALHAPNATDALKRR